MRPIGLIAQFIEAFSLPAQDNVLEPKEPTRRLRWANREYRANGSVIVPKRSLFSKRPAGMSGRQWRKLKHAHTMASHSEVRRIMTRWENRPATPGHAFRTGGGQRLCAEKSFKSEL